MPDSTSVREVAQSAQRRQLTVMFCDLVDSTPMSTRLDPEDMTDIYRVFRDLCASTIEAAGGYVAKYMGDGVMAYFGFPRAHEDDAERAVHAAIGLAESAPRLSTSDDAPLAARIGIATGVVVVGDLVGDNSSEARDVVGETPNLASRLQGAAGPNEILVSNTTQRLASDLFAFEDVGRLPLKGLNLKEPVWRVTGAKAEAERFSTRPRLRGPMLGREAELETLLERWRACLEGGVRIVGIEGEAGIGKSRLVEAFHRRVAVRQPHVWLEGAGAQIYGNTPFYVVAQITHRQLTGGDLLSPAELRERLQQSLKLVGADGGDAVGLIAELIDAASGAAEARPPLASEQRRRALIDALSDWLLKSAERWPTVLVIEDLQWVDPSSRELLETLVGRASKTRLLVLYTARPGAAAPWPDSPAHTRIELGRLDRESARNLVVAAAMRTLPPDLVDRLVARADGVPLFAEELARLAGHEPGDLAIPSALSDLLMARLDQLGPAKDLAQIAAVLGGEFPRALLGAVSGLSDHDLADGLDALLSAGVLVARTEGGEQTLAFRHGLIETAAYETLLKRLRRTLHGRAAKAMLEHFPDIAERRPEVLAQHWLKAGEQAQAITAWRRAARLAFDRFAFRESLHACEQGIALIHSLTTASEFEPDELSLQNMLAEASRTVEGYASSRSRAAMEQAKALVERHGGVQGQLSQAFGEWSSASTRGDYAAALEPGQRFVALARLADEAAVMGSAQMILMSRYRQGDLAGAEAAYQAGQPYFEHPDFPLRPGVAPQTFGTAATIAWLMGHHDEADRRTAHSFLVSRSTGNPYDEAYAFYMAAHHAVRSGTPEEAERMALRAIELARQHGYDAIARSSQTTLGRARAGLGRPAEGAAMIESRAHSGGQPSHRSSNTMYLTWLAEAYAMAGDVQRAEAATEHALTINPLELFFRPEALRVRGDLRRSAGRLADAKVDYEAGLVLARSIGAQTLARRARASLFAIEGDNAAP